MSFRSIVIIASIAFQTAALCAEEGIEQRRVDASTLRGKVLCGYQGWFRGPGDGSRMGWMHWSRDSRNVTKRTLTFEMWPDMREYSRAEKIAVPGFTYPNGQPAHLFSSVHPRTVLRHFEWMKRYGIQGVWLQRFVIDLKAQALV